KRLPLAHRVLGETIEVVGDPRRSLGPRRGVPRVAQHDRARLEAHEWGDRLARGRGEAQRGDRPRRDLPVDRHETAQRAKAQKPDAREDDDHESGSQEDFRAEPHAPLCPTDRGGRRARSPAGPPEPAESPRALRLVVAAVEYRDLDDKGGTTTMHDLGLGCQCPTAGVPDKVDRQLEGQREPVRADHGPRNENMGAQMLKEVASKTSDVAGDGTTTAIVLAQAIYREGLRNVTAGANPMGLKRGIEAAVDAVTQELKKVSKSTKDKKEIDQVATIAANNDKTIGNLIAEAMEKVGKDGVITVEEAKAMETTLEVVEGMQFDRGYLSPY